MKIKIEKSFDKDISKIGDKKILQKLKDIIFRIESAKNLSEIGDIKKITGYQFYYRIRIGDYRLGIEVIYGEAMLMRFLHRKDIYRYFPPK